MTKYLFLLGVFIFSFSFLPIPVSAGDVYTGIAYENLEHSTVYCDRKGMEKQLGGAAKPVKGCSKGDFTNFIFFVEEEGETRDGFKFVHSFISSDDWENREGAYLRVKKTVSIKSCKDAASYKIRETWRNDCEINLSLYRDYKNDIEVREANIFGGLDRRAPDSIKE